MLRLFDIEVGRDVALERLAVDPCLSDTEDGLLDAVPGLLDDTELDPDIEIGRVDIDPGLLELNTGATLVADLVMLVGLDLPCTGLFEDVIAVSPLTLKAGRAIGGALLGLPRGKTVDTTGGELPPAALCPSSLTGFEALIGLFGSIADAAPNPTSPSAATPNPELADTPDPDRPDPDERIERLPSDEMCDCIARGLAPEKDSGLL